MLDKKERQGMIEAKDPLLKMFACAEQFSFNLSRGQETGICDMQWLFGIICI